MRWRIIQLFGITAAMSLGAMLLSQAAMTESQARELADSKVPSGSAYLWTEVEDGRYEFAYYNESRQERYKIKVDQAASALHSFDSERISWTRAGEATLSEETARQKVRDEIPGAQTLSLSLEQDRDDGLTYEVHFSSDDCYGTYKIHPETGQVLERDIKIGADSRGPASTDGYLSYERVAELALGQVPGGTVTDINLDHSRTGAYYEVEVYKDGVEYELAFHAVTGELLWKHSHADTWQGSHRGENSHGKDHSADYIGIDRAKEIALSRVPGAVVKKCELDWDDGRAIYEGELYKDGWEYEFEIDAVDGTVLKWEKDWDD